MTLEISDTVSKETSIKYAFFTGIAPDGRYIILPTSRTPEIRLRIKTLATLTGHLREY